MKVDRSKLDPRSSNEDFAEQQVATNRQHLIYAGHSSDSACLYATTGDVTVNVCMCAGCCSSCGAEQLGLGTRAGAADFNILNKIAKLFDTLTMCMFMSTIKWTSCDVATCVHSSDCA
jgi:hypothetical protein